MDCAHCGKGTEPGQTFCSHCGSRISVASAPPVRKLYRRSAAGRLAGVCAGLAEYLNADVTLVRLAWVILSIVPGGFIGGMLAYLAAWMVMPEATEPASPVGSRKLLTRSRENRRLGGVCGGIAEYLNADPTVVRFGWIVLTILPGVVVFGTIAYLVAWFIIPEGDREMMTPAASAA
jgi:phage shock protein PspC (stress-responsive transcriptional regulator)